VHLLDLQTLCGVMGFFTRASARLLSAPEKSKVYIWGDKLVEFYHCASCGCVTHYEDIEKTPQGRLAINFRLLAPKNYSNIAIRTFDVGDTWLYLD
jgi:hypothetical protein